MEEEEGDLPKPSKKKDIGVLGPLLGREDEMKENRNPLMKDIGSSIR